jgi:4-amino-4-deoxychorismate lyase
MLAVWVNGVPDAALAPGDRGLHYGDGLFETICVTSRGPRLLDRHFERLRRGAAVLGIDLPDEALMRGEIAMAAATSGAGVVKLIVTRGATGRGYRALRGTAPTRLVAAYGSPPYPVEFHTGGVAARVCRTRLAEQPAFAGLKTLNRLEQVLARNEWAEPEPWEGLLLDLHERVVCGTMSNVFCLLDGVWTTPDLSRCGVAGTVRAALLDAARGAGLPCREADLGLADLYRAEEVFLTNAVAGAVPVNRIDQVRFRPGAAVRRAQEWLASWS